MAEGSDAVAGWDTVPVEALTVEYGVTVFVVVEADVGTWVVVVAVG
jgi:hypothetical protein